MNRKLFFSVFLSLLTCVAVAQKKGTKLDDKNTEIWRYDIECEGVGKKGSKLVKVWSYTKKPKSPINSAQKNAVHGLIFKGYSGGVTGCSSFRPLVRDEEIIESKKAFFKKFFKDGGDYLKYVTSATDGKIEGGDVLKLGKKSYKIGIIVSVQTDLLRRRLEKEGIIRSLSSGF